MKRLMILLIITLITSFLFGQKIQVTEQADIKITEKCQDFSYISKYMDLSSNSKIASINGFCINSEKQTLDRLYNMFWTKSNQLGANSFKIDTLIKITNDTILLNISIYYLSKNELDKNFALYPQNMIYVFGDLDFDKPEGRKIRLNGNKVTILPLEYVSYQNKVGEEATVSNGGFMGVKVWIKGKEGRLPKHLSLSGVDFGGIGLGSSRQVIISFTTGRIYPVDLNLGQFLVDVINAKKQLLEPIE